MTAQASQAIEYRAATSQDADVIAPLMYQAAVRLTNYTLGQSVDPVSYIAHCVKNNIGFYGFQYQQLALLDEEIVATATAYESRIFLKLLWQSLTGIFQYFGFFKGLNILRRSLQIGGLFEKPKSDSLFLANICVEPTCRSKGIFGAMYHDSIHLLAKEYGCNSIELDVGIDNPAAQKLYERLGFVVRSEHLYHGSGDLEGVKRMASKR